MRFIQNGVILENVNVVLQKIVKNKKSVLNEKYREYFFHLTIQTIRILIFAALKCLFYYAEVRIHANLKIEILMRLLSHIASEFRRLWSDISIWIHPVSMNQNLTEFIFYFYLS